MTETKNIEVRRIIDPEALKGDMRFAMTDLTSAMMNQASLATHYGMLAAQASRQLHDLQLSLEIAEAKVYRKLRDEAVEKTTEAQLAKNVSLHPTVIALNKAINEAKQVEAQSKTAVEAFRQRRDMLVQVGLLSREEMKGEVSINRRHEVETMNEESRRAAAARVAAAVTRHGAEEAA